MSTLPLPDGARVAVWRAVKDQIRSDPVLSSPPLRLRFYEGRDGDVLRPGLATSGPALTFLATLGRMEWFTERSHAGSLVVSYWAEVPGSDDEDVLNLQEAVEAALYPDDAHAFSDALVAAGAVTGQVAFVAPMAVTPPGAGADGVMRPTGQFVIEVERRFPV